ncbi:hypothetical protein GGTG_05375 [Gaeumannomyces tritici R3-111a-1]|uniref:Prefoldin subunit n=1 Tax=Gaeumannomyces tritici (strain R3-111a-1) TaxID=644352 RepID=J3NVR2_GAET3|nr:hypothetical protein GGTG_05375 [Gaeumannomyces tritici R3-111a-1]EJT75441.1 hypothetical protein GGTG_05375 [Gaeumannomyces tritici R3-111a-1]
MLLRRVGSLSPGKIPRNDASLSKPVLSILRDAWESHGAHSDPQGPRAPPTPLEKRLDMSPNYALTLWLREMSKSNEFDTLTILENTAGNRSYRLPLVTLQRAMKQAEAQGQTRLSDRLPSDDAWRAKLKHLAFKGVTADDIDHWIWVLSADDADERVGRLVSSDRYKPIFVLFNILRKEEVFTKPRSIMRLLEYSAKAFCNNSLSMGSRLPAKPTSLSCQAPVRPLRTLDHRLNMGPEQFEMLLKLLTHHVMLVWPTAIVSIADLAASYIRDLSWAPLDPVRHISRTRSEKIFAARCRLFNQCLQLFETESPQHPVAQMRYNWRAQKVMLVLSSEFARPLKIDRFGFRAIRRVLIALAKSGDEKMVAARLSKTWPPYRQNWDGQDERRQLEDDLSRSVKAGIMMREAGYADDPVDRPLDVLGGAALGESPYVQTRSLKPRVWQGKYANLNIYSHWAAQIKATRNAYEAWGCFQRPPQDGLPPNCQVYAEMFARLFADEVPLTTRTLPGDAKENLPFHDDNLSPFERARIQPPTPEQLYEQMRSQNLRPVGPCLDVLVAHSKTPQEMATYMLDGMMEKEAVHVFLRLIGRDSSTFAYAEAENILGRIPRGIFNACVFALCHMPSDFRTDQPLRTPKQIHLVQSAAKAARVRLRTTPSYYLAPWHTIIGALSRSEHVNRHNGIIRLKVLTLFLDVYRELLRRRQGVDVIMFDKLGLILRRVLEAVEIEEVDPMSDEGKAIHAAHVLLKHAFNLITEPTALEKDQRSPNEKSEASGKSEANEKSEAQAWELDLPPLFYRVNITHLQHYIRAMGLLGDVDEMVRVVEWMVKNWATSTFEDARDPRHVHSGRVAEAFVMFRAFAEAQLSPRRMAELEDRMLRLIEESGYGGPDGLVWPSRLEAEAFVERAADQERASGDDNDAAAVNSDHEDSVRFWKRASTYLKNSRPSSSANRQR